MSQFEQNIKQSLQSFEAEYNPADWNDMQNRLSKAKAGKSVNIGKGLMIAASVAAVAGAVYYFSNANSENTISEKAVVPQTSVHVPAKENTVQKEEANNSSAANNHSEDLNRSAKENVVAVNNPTDNKSVSADKNTTQPVNNKAENKVPVQEPVQTPAIQPVVSSAVALSAAFRSEAKVCEGTPVQFTADYSDASCTYKWTFGDGETSTLQNPTHVFADPGNYSVRLHINSAKYRTSADQKNSVSVVAAPVVRVTADVSEENNLLVAFTADGDKITDWKWNFGDNKTASVQNPSHIYGRKGNYKVEVAVRNSSGCSTLAAKDVNLKLNLLAPNAFSPDGNGTNDTWMPAVLANGEYNFTLTITDKTGNQVFQTSDKNDSWSGQYNGRSARPGDTFIWKVVIKERNGEISNDQGIITITE